MWGERKSLEIEKRTSVKGKKSRKSFFPLISLRFSGVCSLTIVSETSGLKQKRNKEGKTANLHILSIFYGRFLKASHEIPIKILVYRFHFVKRFLIKNKLKNSTKALAKNFHETNFFPFISNFLTLKHFVRKNFFH